MARKTQARPESAQDARRSVAVVALNGLFFPTASRILSEGLLLTWFVSSLSASAFWVGLIVPLQQGLGLLPQPVFAEWLKSKPRRRYYYTGQALLRAGLWALLGFAAAGLAEGSWLLAAFFVVLVLDAAAGGLGNIAFNDTLARAIPSELRGRARGWRGVLGGLLGAAAGWLIKTYFSEASGLEAFGLLFAAAGALYAGGGLVFAFIGEPDDGQASPDRPSLDDLWREMRVLLKDPAFRRFVGVQALLVPLLYGLPFFTLFARREFGLDLKAVGTLVMVDALTPILSNWVWGRLADAHGNRLVIVTASLIGLLAPASGLLLLLGAAPGWALAVMAVIVFAIRTAWVGADLAAKNYLLDLAPGDEQRPLYIGLNDALVGLPAMLMIASGLLLDALGFGPIFAALGGMGLAAAFLAARLQPGAASRA